MNRHPPRTTTVPTTRIHLAMMLIDAGHSPAMAATIAKDHENEDPIAIMHVARIKEQNDVQSSR